MAKVTKVGLEYERKQNLGDFSSVVSRMTVWLDLEPGDVLDKVVQAGWQVVRENVKQQIIRAQGKSATAQVETVFAGLPLELKDVLHAPTVEQEESEHTTVEEVDDADV